MTWARSRAGESAAKAAVTSRSSNLALPDPAPPVADPIVVTSWNPNVNPLTATETGDCGDPRTGVRSSVMAGAAGPAGRGDRVSPSGRAGPPALFSTWSQDVVFALVASVRDPKANFRLSAGSPSPPATASLVRSAVPRTQAATGFAAAARRAAGARRERLPGSGA